ncbi:MAG TPA: hypothetical protein VFT46_07205 [Holophagaceae bacterium]|nr:hypothetical protein [Holophagaceae bacterium]
MTRSFSQTDLAAKYAMPAQPSSGAGYLVMGILFAVPALFMLVFLMDPDTRGCGIATSFVFGLFSGVFLLIYFAGREGRARAAQQWQARWEYIHRAWVCLRCGHEWIPEA